MKIFSVLTFSILFVTANIVIIGCTDNATTTQTKTITEFPQNSPADLLNQFKDRTSLETDPSWQIVDFREERGDFLGDGETHIILKLPNKAITTLLESRPPWSSSWKKGFIPDDIKNRFSDSQLSTLLQSSDFIYDFKERCCDSLPLHNGDLLIVDPIRQQVWLAIWDF